MLKNDPNYLTGFPDWLILYGPCWAALEIKRSKNSRIGPNQQYYINLANELSYANFVYPENEREVLSDLQQALQFKR